MPSGRHMLGTASRFGDDLPRHQQPKLDADTGEPDPIATRFRTRRNIVVSAKFLPLHTTAVVDDGQGGVGRVGQQADAGRTRVERVGDDFGEDRFVERTGVGVPKVFEEMLKVDAVSPTCASYPARAGSSAAAPRLTTATLVARMAAAALVWPDVDDAQQSSHPT
jgi:hypothetical protein